MSRCIDYRAQMIAFVRGELKALEHARIESHVARCSECGALEKTIRAGFTAAAGWEPAVAAQHIQRLERRLAPYVEQARPRVDARRFVVSAAVVAVAAVLALIAVIVPWRSAETPALRPIVTERREMTPELSVVSSRDWDGRIAKIERPRASRKLREGDTAVAMDRGFAVMAFDGGEGRALIVETPNISVEVVDTKFFVGVVQGELTTVGVITGRAQIVTPAGTRELGPGETATWDAKGAVVAGAAVPAAETRASVEVAAQLLEKPKAVAALESEPEEAPLVVAPPETEPDRARESTVPAAVAEAAREKKAQPSARATQDVTGEGSSDPVGARSAMQGATGAGSTDQVGAGGATQGATSAVARSGEEAENSRASATGAAGSDQPAEGASGTAGSSTETPPIGAPIPRARTSDVLARLAQAERLTSHGLPSDALRAYRALLEDGDPAIDPHRALVRYEIARLHAFHLGDPARARTELLSLADRESGEVGTQAAFALCELELPRSPCAARACLLEIAGTARLPNSVRLEASELTRRWKIDQLDCRDHKRGSDSQLK